MPINTTPVNNEEEKVNKFYTAINHYALEQRKKIEHEIAEFKSKELEEACLLYTSPSPRDLSTSRMPSSA